jgi:hypothetical protein
MPKVVAGLVHRLGKYNLVGLPLKVANGRRIQKGGYQQQTQERKHPIPVLGYKRSVFVDIPKAAANTNLVRNGGRKTQQPE